MNKAKLNIRYAMTKHGISYATLAERTGIDKGNISKLFTGNPTISKIEAVADAIGIDIRDLFFLTDEEGNIVEEPKQNVQELLDEIERLKQGPLFSRDPQDAQQVLCCPKCATTFLVTNVPTKPLPTE